MKQFIKTEHAPAPIGPYNQAVLVNDTLYVSGQIGLNPVSMELVEGGVVAETEQVMLNLKAVLDAANMSFDNVIKSTIFVADMHDFSKVNEVYGKYFDSSTAPARECVEASNLPKFVTVEISVIAVK
ncbi:MAG: RidA family protein [Flavobacteriaceae bacterium]